MKRLTLILACGLVLPCSTYTDSILTKQDVAVGMCLVSAAVASYLIYSWATYQTDSQVVDAAQEMINDTQQKYQDLLVLANRYTEALLDNRQLTLTGFLTKIYHTCMAGEDPQSYIKSLECIAGKLKRTSDELKKRLDSLDHTAEHELLKQRAIIVLDNLTQLQGSLRIMHSCLQTHRHFFDLQHLYTRLEKRYAQMLPIAYQLQNNPYLIEAAAEPMQTALSGESHYVYIDFYVQLYRDCKQLTATINAVPRSYEGLSENAQLLSSWLEFLANSVARSNRYALELFYKQTRSIDKEIEELSYKQKQLHEKRSVASMAGQYHQVRLLDHEIDSVTRLIQKWQQKKKELRANMMSQTSNSFNQEYVTVA